MQEMSMKEVKDFPKCSNVLIIDVVHVTLVTMNLQTGFHRILRTLDIFAKKPSLSHHKPTPQVGLALENQYWPQANPFLYLFRINRLNS